MPGRRKPVDVSGNHRSPATIGCGYTIVIIVVIVAIVVMVAIDPLLKLYFSSVNFTVNPP